MLFFVGLAWISTAQDVELKMPKQEIILKAYANFLKYTPDYGYGYFQYHEEGFSFTGISAAVHFHNPERNLIHEFEMKYWFSNGENGDIKESEAGLRYELCWHVKLKFIPGLRFRWGFSSRFYYSKIEIKSDPFSGGRVSSITGGIEIAATAHLDYRISKKVNIDIAFTNFNYNFGIERYSSLNAAFSSEQTSSDVSAFDQNLLRIGLGYIL